MKNLCHYCRKAELPKGEYICDTCQSKLRKRVEGEETH